MGGTLYPPYNLPETTMETHEQLIVLLEQYKFENEKFARGNKSAGVRARKVLMEIIKASKTRRAEIQEEKEWIVKK